MEIWTQRTTLFHVFIGRLRVCTEIMNMGKGFYLSIYLFILTFNYMFIYLSVCLFIPPCIYLPIHLFICR